MTTKNIIWAPGPRLVSQSVRSVEFLPGPAGPRRSRVCRRKAGREAREGRCVARYPPFLCADPTPSFTPAWPLHALVRRYN